MKKIEEIPTEENILKTMSENILNRNKDIIYFYKLLEAQEGNCTIAIDGRWGSGKTFFVRQAKMMINALNPLSGMNDETRTEIIDSLGISKDGLHENSSVAVYYDAWENDNDTKPVFSLIYEITKQLSIDFSLSDISVVRIASSIINAIKGYNIEGIVEALKSDNPFKQFKEEKSVDEKIQEFFSEILKERGNRLVIFIDELDRCKPTYAVELLEQLKHYITDHRITVVFSVNITQLQHTIERYYGMNFDSCRYLDRFFDIRISLPDADLGVFYNKMGVNSQYYIDDVMKKLVAMFNFELREMTRFCSQVKAAIYEPTHNSSKYDFSFSDGKGRIFILIYIVPLLIGLKIADISKYNSFINGENSDPLRELLHRTEHENIMSSMLNGNESFEDEEGKTLVTYDEIADRIYEAIFIKQYDKLLYSTEIGQYEFKKSSRALALRVASLMSDYADLN